MPAEERSLDSVALLKRILDREDWELLFDQLADGVVFEVTIPGGTPIGGQLRGKRAVVEQLKNLGNLAELRQERPLECFGRGDRVVALGTGSFEVTKSGGTIRGSHHADVVDLREGLITRFLIVQGLSAFVEAYHPSDPPCQARPRPRDVQGRR
jgi:ketosteroid isomerase-like protein